MVKALIALLRTYGSPAQASLLACKKCLLSQAAAACCVIYNAYAKCLLKKLDKPQMQGLQLLASAGNPTAQSSSEDIVEGNAYSLLSEADAENLAEEIQACADAVTERFVPPPGQPSVACRVRHTLLCVCCMRGSGQCDLLRADCAD